MARRRLQTGERKEMILVAAAMLVKQEGIQALTHEDVADRCELDTSVATVRRYYGSWRDLADALCGHLACPADFKDYVGRL